MLVRYLGAFGLSALLLAACGPAAPPPQTASPPVTLTPATPTALLATAAPPTSTLPPTAPPTSIPATAVPPTPVPPTQPPTQPPAGPINEELLFLRQGALIALDLGTQRERQLASQVIDFAPAPGARAIALLRDLGAAGVDLWLIQRDGGGLRQLTSDGSAKIEATPSWAPDGAALAYAASTAGAAYAPTWLEWAAWCGTSEVRVLTVADGASQSFGPGCDPAISPDGKRIAYATPPGARSHDGATVLDSSNAIRLINRQGQNGWNFAEAAGAPNAPAAKRGLLVYAPAWSADGAQLAYQRFLGYQALVDINLTEIGGSFEGKGQPLSDGAGWLLPARFAPGGRLVALVDNNFSDARGFGGYDNWSVAVLTLTGSHTIALPEGNLTAVGERVGELPRAQAAAWAPGGQALAVLLPPGWSPSLPADEPVDADGQPGEIWLWQPDKPPIEQLAAQADFASPLAWLPAL